MADTKISALSAITTLDGTEEFVVADSGATKKITGANLATELGGFSLLYSNTLGGDAASIDTGASGIAGGYNILEAWIIARTAVVAVASSVLVTVNNDTGANYDDGYVQNLNTSLTGANALAATAWTLISFGASAQAGAATTIRLTIPGYALTTFHKMGEYNAAQVEDTAADARTRAGALRWRSTAAITRMTVTGNTGDLKAGSSLFIYGR